MGSSKFYYNNKKDQTLEDHFFELEEQMENKTVCRDSVCRNAEIQKGTSFNIVHTLISTNFEISDFVCEVIEILLYILLPEEDFQCKALRYVLREIFTNCVILPLFSLLSDPDYINQAIIWLVSR